MITSFFGPHSFGGDSVYIERLSQTLQQLGHEVHVIYNSSAFDLLHGSQSAREYQAPQRLVVHDIGGGLRGIAGVLWNHQTGGSGLKHQRLGALLDSHQFDVIHMHNISLMGGRSLPQHLIGQNRTVKLVTMHDYWWICPQSLFWKYNRKVCDVAACWSCAVYSRRPPQFWRGRGWFNTVLERTDAVLFPSRSAMEIYRDRGFIHPQQHILPGVLPEHWTEPVRKMPGPRPYFAAAGRLVIEKGFQTLIPVMRRLPDADLRIAGGGPAEYLLRRLAGGLSNVRFEGLLNHEQIRSLFLGARAVVVPSLFPETFGIVAAEAMSLGTPIIVRNRGALPELIEAADGGLSFDHEDEMLDQMRRIAEDDRLFGRLSQAASTHIPAVWRAESHAEAYLKMIEKLREEAGPA